MQNRNISISQMQDQQENDLDNNKFWIYPDFNYNLLDSDQFSHLKEMFDNSEYYYYSCDSEWLINNLLDGDTNTKGVVDQAVINLLTNMISNRMPVNYHTTQQETDLNTVEISAFFNGIKLHWLCADSRVTGISYPIQGQLTDTQLIAHPGTFRWYASIVNAMAEVQIIFATLQQQEMVQLSFKDWIRENSNGFIREKRKLVIDQPDGFPVVTENENHHDDHIYNHGYALQEMFAGKKVTIYIGIESSKLATKTKNEIIKEFSKVYVWDEKDYKDHFDIKIINPDFKYSIPEINNFSGVSIYVEPDVGIPNADHLLQCLLYIDSVDSVAYTEKHLDKFMVFNNSHRDCKKLITEIIHESKASYLNTFLWTGCQQKIPEEVIL